MSSFFDQYSDFETNPTASLVDEFERLAITRHWAEGSKKWRKARHRCFVEDFAFLLVRMGSTILARWQALCDVVGMEHIPTSITQCKEELNMVNINLIDLMDAVRANSAVQKFDSRRELREYTKDTGRIFPKDEAKRNGFLKILLQEIF